MALILSIETSASICSVSVCQNGQELGFLREELANSHSTKLTVLISELLNTLQLKIASLDAVAVSSGPGSYTGLRIGVSVAKGLCYGANKPLLAVPTLEIVAEAIRTHALVGDALICPMIDARRMEVYSALYDEHLHVKRLVEAEIVTCESYSELLEKHQIFFAGTGAPKCMDMIQNPNAIFLTELVSPLASQMAQLAEDRYRKGLFESVAYFEPFYLKAFSATTPKNKVL